MPEELTEKLRRWGAEVANLREGLLETIEAAKSEMNPTDLWKLQDLSRELMNGLEDCLEKAVKLNLALRDAA